MNKTLRLTLVALALVVSAGCGFHLRGPSSAGVAAPETLSRLRVIVHDSRLAYEPLSVAVKNALETDLGVVVTEDPQVPALMLSGEHVARHVLSVDSNSHVNGYVVRYEVSFRLVDAKGAELQSRQTVRVIREYSFDPLSLLAKDREEQEIKRAMLLDAARQIVHRLSRYTPPKT